ncbi:hypothetical protein [Nitrosophilus alvini]|uniref:hypothetical protein n=1 Tax=Nitrosophilus alvini TaxID=2714855 RepID=UPI00190D2AA6|nr:hypothetical protein [Nitrosophilus alvini]
MPAKIYTFAVGKIVSVRRLSGKYDKEFVEVALNMEMKDKDGQNVFMTTYVNFNIREYERLKNSEGKYLATVFKTFMKSDERSELKTFTHDKSIDYMIFDKNPFEKA